MSGWEELSYNDDDDDSVSHRSYSYRYRCVSDSSSEPSSKRRRARKKPDRIDRISRLPESVIVHILSFLPTLDSIRTGVLSKSWQFLWTCVPTLRFSHFDRRDVYRDTDYTGFVELIDKTLALCDSSVKDFAVSFSYRNQFASNVNLWTRFALNNGVQKFELDFLYSKPYDDHIYELPQFLFTNSTFRELRFALCKVEPKTTVAWNSLKKLSIGNVNLNDDAIQRILGGTPLLEILEIYSVGGLDSLHIGNSSVKKLILRGRYWHDMIHHPLEISAPNVQSLEVSGHYLNCDLVDVKSLVEATIHHLYLRYSTDDELVNQARGLLDSLAHVKTLTLGTWAIKGLAMLHTKHLSPRLSKCECLTLDTELWDSHALGIAILLRHYPLLQSLIVPPVCYELQWDYGVSSSPLRRVEEEFSATPVPFSGYTHLRTVKFVGFWYYSEPVYQFVQILLKNARMLQKMIIHVDTEDCYRPRSADELFEIAQKLLSFQRASPNAQLLVYK